MAEVFTASDQKGSRMCSVFNEKRRNKITLGRGRVCARHVSLLSVVLVRDAHIKHLGV